MKRHQPYGITQCYLVGGLISSSYLTVSYNLSICRFSHTIISFIFLILVPFETVLVLSVLVLDHLAVCLTIFQRGTRIVKYHIV